MKYLAAAGTGNAYKLSEVQPEPPELWILHDKIELGTQVQGCFSNRFATQQMRACCRHRCERCVYLLVDVVTEGETSGLRCH
jgi:hypothetical protein